jgi:hypothetical protein
MWTIKMLEELNLNKGFCSKFELADPPQPHKSLLKSGMKVVYRDGGVRYVLIETNSLHYSGGTHTSDIENFNDDLTSCEGFKVLDIMEIWDGETLIAKRTEKTPQQIEIDRIETEMRKLADDLRKVKGE